MKKQLIRLMTAGALLCSMLVTANAQDAAAPAPQRKTTEQRIEMRVNHLKEKLALTDEQVVKLKALFTEQEKNRQEQKANSGERTAADMKEMRKKMSEDIEKILTPEQAAKYKEMQKQGLKGSRQTELKKVEDPKEEPAQ